MKCANLAKLQGEEQSMQEQYNRSKLSRAEFCTALCAQVEALLGKEYCAEVAEKRKNNGVQKEVLHIRKENSECIPCFYTEELYRSYGSGDSVAGLAEYMANIVLGECEKVVRCAKIYGQRDWMVGHLFFRLINYEKNKEVLQDAVYYPVLNLAAVVYVLTEENEDGVKSYRLPKSLWEMLEIGAKEDCFLQIAENTRKLFPEELLCLESMLVECITGRECFPNGLRLYPADELHAHTLYLLTNHRKINGAAVLLYPGVLEALAERFGGAYYIIPSSIHELLLLKDTEEENAARLNEIVREVNASQVEPEEVLADHVYHFSKERGLTIGVSYI